MTAVEGGIQGGTAESRLTTNDRVLIGMAVLAVLGGVAAGILAADSAIIAVALASAAFLGVAIILRPDLATLTTLFILYTNTAVIAVRFHDLPLFAGAAVPLLLVAPLARDLIVRRLPVVAPPMLGWMIVLLVVHLVSALFSSDLVRAWDAVVVYAIEGVGLYFLLVNVIRTPEMLRQATWVLLVAGAFVSIPSIHQDLTNNYGSNYLGFAQASNAAFGTGQSTLTGEIEQVRLAGSIGESNRFAQVMLMLVPLGLYRAIGERRTLLRVTAGVMTTIITLGVILTFSRGAAVGLLLLLVALAALRMVRWRYIALIALAFVLVLAAFPQYVQRATSILEVATLLDPDASRSQVGGAILSRTTEVLAAGLVMVDHPVLGVGPGMFPIFYEEYASQIGLRVLEGATRESHNLYLGLGAELGIVGLGIFLIIGLLTFQMIFKARRLSLNKRPDLERLTTPFGLALMTYYVTGMFLHLSFARFFWLMLAVASAAAIITIREMTTAEEPGSDGQDPYSQSV